MNNETYYDAVVETEISKKTKKQKEERAIRAGNRKKKVSKNMYFTLETENAIILYNKETDPYVKNKIYNDYIKEPIEKLVENIFNRFGFSYFDSHPSDVMAEAVSNILIQLNKFKEGKGKAFSYFSIVCKNYLIQINNKNHEKWKDKETLLSAMPVGWEVEDDFYVTERQSESNEFTTLMINFWDNNASTVFNKKRDIEIAFAVVELFRSPAGVELFNKKAIYCYIREMTGWKTTHITKVIKTMKEIVREMMNEYSDFGHINETSAKYNKMFWVNSD